MLTTASSNPTSWLIDDQAARVLAQEIAQPGDRIGVEVVRRLVEKQGGGLPGGAVREQDAGQLDPAALTA